MNIILLKRCKQFQKSINLEYEGKGLKRSQNANVKGGHNLVKYWLSKWDGTPKSLENLSGGDCRSILTEQEKKKYVDRYVTKKKQKRCSKLCGSEGAY